MANSPTWLAQYGANRYSQTGEDGIVRKVLDTLPALNKWCVEFGAWDGIHLSNTRLLIEEHAYSAVLIEASARRFKQLRENITGYPSVYAINRLVGFAPADCLDSILAESPIPADFDFLSIDIDGNDYHVWKAMTRYRPKLVCIEFNPTVPTDSAFVQPANPALHHGCGLLSLVELGRQKGYELVATLSHNAFFVTAELFHLFGITDNRPWVMRTDLSYVTHMFSGYDGTVLLEGYRKLPWHGALLRESRVQAVGRLLRRYPPDYGILTHIYIRLRSVAARILRAAGRQFGRVVGS